MPPVNVLIKPASGDCNLRCRYCFYHDETQNRETRSFGRMSDETLEHIVQKALAYADGSCSFGFQGGEPTLAGLDFFRKVVAYERQYNIKNVRVFNAIQTNGTLLDEPFAQFLAEEKFLVGLSLDGDENLHDLYRRDAADAATGSRVLAAAKLLKRCGAEFNILTVVTAQTAKRIADIYRYFMRSGFVYQQYIPCLDPIGRPRGQEKYSLTPALYARFLIRLFDLWYADRSAGRFVYIRYFENLAGMMMGRPPESCGVSGICSPQHAFEADGSAYPCDFYMLDGYCIGNIHEDDFPAIEENRRKLGFIQQSAILPEQCRSCRFLQVCRGGCRRDRIPETDADSGLNYYCEAYQAFFAHALPLLRSLLDPRRLAGGAGMRNSSML